MEIKLYTLLFPNNERVQIHWGIFYRGSRCVLADDNSKLLIPAYETIDFATYFNGFSYQKWKTYTNLQAVKLYLTMLGEFTVELVGYDFNGFTPVRHSYGKFSYDLSEETSICLTYEECNQQLLSFEIHAHTNCQLYDGYYTGEYKETDKRPIELAIATTTCFKEEYIIHNMELLKQEILECEEDISKHVNIHVIDNGSTLDVDKYSTEHLTVYPNKNVGGSGGFARGMMEAMKQEPRATHVLLMDDDVIVLPESIKKTYTLLSLLKPEYQGNFIAGAMLAMEDMCILHEDLGTVRDNGEVCPRHRDLNMWELINVLRTEMIQPNVKNEFGAWWYCCIPVEAIEKNGLPLPIFIRGDDIEYGLRCRPGFITMNGICLWHMGFTNKFNPAIDIYQVYRNLLIIQSASGVCQKADFMVWIKRVFRQMIMEYNYGAAELALAALEDYLKGPEFLYEDNGEKILKEYRNKNEVLIPISQFDDSCFEDVEIRLDEVYFCGERGILSRILYALTLNGHRLFPNCMLKKEPAIIGYDWSYQPGRQAFRKYLLSVNPIVQTMAVREKDKKKYRLLIKKRNRLMCQYKKKRETLTKQYADAFEKLTSVEFWERYLQREGE